MRNELRNATLWVVLSAALLASAAVPASAQAIVGLQVQPYTKVTKVTNVTGTVSATVDFCGRPARVLDNARGEYAGVYPLGAGGSMDICPNPILDMTLPNAHIVAMAAVSGDTMPNYLWDKKRGIGSFCGSNVTNLEFDGKRFHHRIPLDVSLGIGTQNNKYMGLIAGGQRDDHTLVVLIHWPDTKEIARLVDTFRFMTVLWPANVTLPTYEAFCQFLEDAGCGGVRADIYDRLVERTAQRSVSVQNGQELPPGQSEADIAETLTRNTDTVAAIQKVIDGLVANDTSLKGAVEALSDQVVAVNDDLQKTKAEMASGKDQPLIVGRLNELSVTVGQLVDQVRAIVAWHDQISAPAPPAATSEAQYWDVTRTADQEGKPYLRVTAKVNGVRVEADFGPQYVRRTTTLSAGRWVDVKVIASMRVTVTSEDGSHSKCYGPN